ncbi:MAG TPA: MaoC family dehydratase [Rhodoblastus sp.]|nr:MaoC family dehydratase [Rhodoblastus sp.]
MAIKRIKRGYLYEDFEEGRVLEHHWGRTFTEHDAIWFATMTMQYGPLYSNVEYARSLGYSTIPVHPIFVFTTALGLSVEDLSEAGGPFLGVDDLIFHRPVYAGDTIRSRSQVMSRRASASRPGWGIVEWKTAASNQRSEPVLEYRRRNLSRMRTDTEKNA